MRQQSIAGRLASRVNARMADGARTVVACARRKQPGANRIQCREHGCAL